MSGEAGPVAAEWAVAALGGAFLAVTVGAIAWEGFGEPQASPAFVTEIRALERMRDRQAVTFVIRNISNATAADVRVRAVFTPPHGPPETVEIVFDFVPAESERQGTITLAGDPRQGRLDLHAVSWTKP